jgi:Protein of unknown function (DUF2919)
MRDSAFLDVDRYGVLRVPLGMWLGLIVLARHWVLLIVVGASARRESRSVLLLGDDGVPWLAMVMEVPALVLMLLAFRRTPEALSLTRRLWRLGPWFAAATAALNAAWTVQLLLQNSHWRPWPELALASMLLLDFAIVAAFFTAPYYRQLFSEFPEPPAPDQAKAQSR